MSKRTYLGEMELMVLLAVVRLGEDAYGVPISKELLILARREVALGNNSVYREISNLPVFNRQCGFDSRAVMGRPSLAAQDF